MACQQLVIQNKDEVLRMSYVSFAERYRSAGKVQHFRIILNRTDRHERLNRAILKTSSKRVPEKPADWDLWLDLVIMAYRAAKQMSSSCSPFQLLQVKEEMQWFLLPLNFSVRAHGVAQNLADSRQTHHRVEEEKVEENEAVVKAGIRSSVIVFAMKFAFRWEIWCFFTIQQFHMARATKLQRPAHATLDRPASKPESCDLPNQEKNK